MPTVDILASLGKIKTTQTLIGFALETENEVANAQTKLEKKNLNGIVLNSLRDAGAGFDCLCGLCSYWGRGLQC